MNSIERNGLMITLARELKGITQSELASKIPNLNQSNLSKLEVGVIDVSNEIWNNIAKYFELPLNFFAQSRPKTPISSFYYRKRQIIPKKKLAELEAKFDILRLSTDKLLNIIDIPEFDLPSFDIETTEDKILASEIAARKIREAMRIPKGPILNIVENLERHGIIVYFINDVIDKFDGITLYTDKGQPMIFVNGNIPNDRKRFTIAHELGHLVLHIRSTQDLDRDEETEANQFAAEFLMPRIEIFGMLSFLNLNKVATLKDYWLVSKSALIRRAYDLRIIDKNKYTYFNIELSRRGEKKIERGYVKIDNPTILNRILSILRKELSYSKEDLCNLFCIPHNLYDSLFDNDSKLRISF